MSGPLSGSGSLYNANIVYQYRPYGSSSFQFFNFSPHPPPLGRAFSPFLFLLVGIYRVDLPLRIQPLNKPTDLYKDYVDLL